MITTLKKKTTRKENRVLANKLNSTENIYYSLEIKN